MEIKGKGWMQTYMVEHVETRKEREAVAAWGLLVYPYLTQSVFNVVLQKSTPPQMRQLVLYYY